MKCKKINLREGKFRKLGSKENFVTYTTTKCLPYYSLNGIQWESFGVKDEEGKDKKQNIFLHLMKNGFCKKWGVSSL